MSLFQFTLVYRPGAEAIVPDALSRREQDMLEEDNKNSRFRRFLEPDRVANWPDNRGGAEVVVATTLIQLLLIQLDQDPAVQQAESQGPF
jgi:hypothetical protein